MARMDWTRWRAEFPSAARQVHMNHAGISPLPRRVAAAIRTFADEALLLDGAVYRRLGGARRGGARRRRAADRRARARDRLRAQHVGRACRWSHRAWPGSRATTSSPWPTSIRPTSIRGSACAGSGSRRGCWRGRGCASASTTSRRRSTRARACWRSARSIGSRGSAPISRRSASSAARATSCSSSTGSRRWARCRSTSPRAASTSWRPADTSGCWLRRAAACCSSPTASSSASTRSCSAGRASTNAGAYLPYHFELRADAARLEPGSAPHLGIHALGAAVDLLLEIGPAAIEARVLEHHRRARRRAAPARRDGPEPARGAERSAILTFALGDTAALHRALTDAGIIVRPRLGGIRLAPHFYNDATDVARVLEVVKRFAADVAPLSRPDRRGTACRAPARCRRRGPRGAAHATPRARRAVSLRARRSEVLGDEVGDPARQQHGAVADAAHGDVEARAGNRHRRPGPARRRSRSRWRSRRRGAASAAGGSRAAAPSRSIGQGAAALVRRAERDRRGAPAARVAPQRTRGPASRRRRGRRAPRSVPARQRCDAARRARRSSSRRRRAGALEARDARPAGGSQAPTQVPEAGAGAAQLGDEDGDAARRPLDPPGAQAERPRREQRDGRPAIRAGRRAPRRPRAAVRCPHRRADRGTRAYATAVAASSGSATSRATTAAVASMRRGAYPSARERRNGLAFPPGFAEHPPLMSAREAPARARRYAVIMAGGVGTRFWPHSRRRRPKQFLAMDGGRARCCRRPRSACAGWSRGSASWSSRRAISRRWCGASCRRCRAPNLVIEPAARGTAACLALRGGVDRAARPRRIDGGVSGRPRHRRGRRASSAACGAGSRPPRQRTAWSPSAFRRPAPRPATDTSRPGRRLRRGAPRVALGGALRREARPRHRAALRRLRTLLLEFGHVRLARGRAARGAGAPRAGGGAGHGGVRAPGGARTLAAARRAYRRLPAVSIDVGADGARRARRAWSSRPSTGATSAAGRRCPALWGTDARRQCPPRARAAHRLPRHGRVRRDPLGGGASAPTTWSSSTAPTRCWSARAAARRTCAASSRRWRAARTAGCAELNRAPARRMLCFAAESELASHWLELAEPQKDLS